jgi:taurine dioxygenase
VTMNIRRMSYALGAEITGLDVSRPLDDGTVRQLQAAFLEHMVLVFRNQTPTREQYVAFGRRFGVLDRNETYAPEKKAPGLPEITLVVSRPKPNGEPATGRFNGQDWHTDHSHQPDPCSATLLLSKELPPLGGDTQFCNMYRAYDTLSDGMKKMLEGLHGVHMESVVLDRSTPERYAESRRLNPSTAHPLVRVHPETGRKALYVSDQMKLIVGMTAEESLPLIRMLVSHAVRPQNIYRHQWQKHDLVMWDNRCLLHIALGDYDRRHVRHMEKMTVNGDVCGYPYDGPLD